MTRSLRCGTHKTLLTKRRPLNIVVESLIVERAASKQKVLTWKRVGSDLESGKVAVNFHLSGGKEFQNKLWAKHRRVEKLFEQNVFLLAPQNWFY